MDIFNKKGIKPMLIAEMQFPFDSDDFIYELKLDGIRCIAYLDSKSVDIRNKRNKSLLQNIPELSHINKHVNAKCILDGELFVLKNGKTDFFEIQRRVMLSDAFKIELASKKHPACFVAFDILYKNGKLLDNVPLIERKYILESTINDNEFISWSRHISKSGISFYEAAKAQGMEGVVAKRIDSKYLFDKRSKDWIKFKVMNTDDVVICGYIPKSNNMTSLIIGQYLGETLIYKGHVTLGVSIRTILPMAQISTFSPFVNLPKGNEKAIWFHPSLVGIIEYMPSDKPGYRQAVFKGIRDDKTPVECQTN